MSRIHQWKEFFTLEQRQGSKDLGKSEGMSKMI